MTSAQPRLKFRSKRPPPMQPSDQGDRCMIAQLGSRSYRSKKQRHLWPWQHTPSSPLRLFNGSDPARACMMLSGGFTGLVINRCTLRSHSTRSLARNSRQWPCTFTVLNRVGRPPSCGFLYRCRFHCERINHVFSRFGRGIRCISQLCSSFRRSSRMALERAQ